MKTDVSEISGNESPGHNHTPKFGDKRAVADMIGMSVRSVDNFLRAGMPAIFLSRRRVRFDLEEVRAWLKARYGTRRLGSAMGGRNEG